MRTVTYKMLPVVTAASKGGPRYNGILSDKQRSGVENGIYLCSACADLVDKNQGRDYPVALLRSWKRKHERWVSRRSHQGIEGALTVVSGEHSARGIGKVIGLDIRRGALLKPGTRVSAEGIGTVIGTKIGRGDEE